MLVHWKKFIAPLPQIVGKKIKYDNNIYTFDIETTSFFILGGKMYSALEYKDLTKKQQEQCDFRCNMYIWMLSVNDIVYYGRTWDELRDFIKIIDNSNDANKIIFVHNLAFEFQFLKSIFTFKEVLARISHKVMKCKLLDYKIEFRCSYLLSNCALKYLPELFNLPVEKKIGDLDYNKLRHSKTPLTETEKGYCENDCLVVYHYIKMELENYIRINKIPLTSTGHVRRELQEITRTDYIYKRKVYKAINTDPHVYNLLIDSFQGGYTHANWLFTDEIIHDVDSYDFCSSYPYILCTHRFPATEFKKCNIKKRDDMYKDFAYLLKVRFYNIECKYYNTFISQSKCSYVEDVVADNGRIMKAKEIEITLTDIDFYFILDTYSIEKYEILESYNSVYNYLPKLFINFILEKYINKTKFKNVPGKEIEYSKEKNKFNSLYGMCVTNMIRDDVEYDNITGWNEKEISNEEIQKRLLNEKKKSFLSFAYGVWCTAYARNNLLRNAIKLDDYCIYMDTDSLKLRTGYDIKVIENYNKFVENKIKYVSKRLEIPIEKFAPKDSKGKLRMLGVFDFDGHYDKFITQGAKKYAVEENGEIKITVAGVPKEGAKELKRIEDFRDDLVFHFENTNKQLLFYIEGQKPIKMIDYTGIETEINDISGCGLFPTSYVLGKALEYCDLLTDNSSKRARYKEGI